MNIIVENLSSNIKSKSPSEWTKDQLEEFYFDISSIYYYTPFKDKEERELLKKLFNRVIELLSLKGRLSLNPGKLDFLDKTSKF